MTASDDGCMDASANLTDVLHDIETLRPQQLRKKYRLEANSHRAMLQRASQGRVIDPAWGTFSGFLADMGRKPSPEHSIDRIDPANPVYGPGLCRWATKLEQTKNRRNTIIVSWNDEDITLAEFARAINRPYKQVHYRYSIGHSLEEIAADTERSSKKFVPERLSTEPELLAAWERDYSAWRNKVIRARKRFARPEVYEIVVLGSGYRKAQAWLTQCGYFELSAEEGDRARELNESPMGRMYRFAPEAMRQAARALLKNDPKVGIKIIGDVPFRYWDMWVWADWFLGRDGQTE